MDAAAMLNCNSAILRHNGARRAALDQVVNVRS
jgi:hypothetical protein